ncbi:MAG: hypothetical protein Q4G45_01015 [Actinomycetia bacterium]|nr:hypothetical protein [Actinomycetes bacterium]
MAQEWTPRGARRAADDAPLSRPTGPARPRRLVTPDWDLDDGLDDEGLPGTTARAREAGSRLSSLSGAHQYSSPPVYRAPEPAPRRPARGLPPEPAPGRADTSEVDWRPVTIDPVPGAARAAEPATMAEKRRREAPALPTTPAPAPQERRSALLAQEQSQQTSVAPGTRPTDDWQDAPLPAAAVPPPLAGHAPDPIEVTSTDVVPQEHRAFTRPAEEDTASYSPDFARAADAGLATSVAPHPSPEPTESLADRLRRERAAGVSSRLGPPRRGSDPASWEAGPAPSDKPRRRFPMRIVLVALVVVAALGVGAVILVRTLAATGSAPGVSTAATSTGPMLSEADLATAADLSQTGPGTWQTTTETAVAASAPLPLCVTSSTNQPVAQTAMQRELTAGDAQAIHRVEGYVSPGDATQVYALRQTMMGRCSNIPVYLVDGAKVIGLGDEAVAISAVLQDTTPVYHTVLLVRTGRVVDMYDLKQPGTPITYDQVVAAAKETLTRQCPRSEGACPTTPSVELGLPPAGDVTGWLTVADLHRITPGVGRWQANDVTTKVDVAGSGCENLKLDAITGPTARKQRTYLLQEDAKAPQTFGIDEVLLEFPTPEMAQMLTTQVNQNITECPKRTGSAQLGGTGPVEATGAGGEKITGFWRTVRQDTSATTFALYRVSVLSVGTKVVYVYGTPSATYDFSDEAWLQIAVRAGQRATQAG